MNRNPNITKEVLQKLYLEEDLSTIQIAEKIGASKYGVYTALQRFGLCSRTRSESASLRARRTREINWPSVANEYTAGKSIELLASDYKCSMATVWAHLKKIGIEIRKDYSWCRKLRKPIDMDKAVALNQNGMLSVNIARKFNISPQILYKRFKEMKYKPLRAPRIYKTRDTIKHQFAQQIDATYCRVCGETRAIDLAHVQARRHSGPLKPENIIPMCATHHRCFDRGLLTDSEIKKIEPVLCTAAQAGYHHQHYGQEAT